MPHSTTVTRKLLYLGVIHLTLLAPIRGQTSTAELVGRVYDHHGAAVVGVVVRARNQRLESDRTVQSNQEGEYSIKGLPAGTYEVSFTAPSFAKLVIPRVDLSVGVKATLNAELGSTILSGAVVTIQAPLLAETRKAEITSVVTPREALNLPLVNRTFAALSIITPEARPAGNFDPAKTRIGNVAFSGGDGRQTNVSVDGGDNKDNVIGSVIQNFPYESIQEFQILENNWTAEAGRAVGAIINVVTKSGSNRTHGSFFSNFLDDSLRSKSFFENRDARKTTSYSRQEGGGSLGGPIIHDRLVFFGALEQFRERSNIFTPNGVLEQLLAVPGAKPTANIPASYDDQMLIFRVDHHVNDDHRLFYRYAQQNNHSNNDLIIDPSNTDQTGGNTHDNRALSLMGSHTWATQSNLNQFLLYYQNFKNEILASSTLPILTFPANIQTGSNVNVPQATTETKFQVRDDFSRKWSNFTMNFGGNYIYTSLGGYKYFSKGYQLTFFDSPISIRNNTNGKYPAGFATPGAVRALTFSDGDATHQQSLHQLALYVEDDIRAGRRLTLNLGLRWDVNIGELVDQTHNRTIRILRELNDSRAQAIAGDPKKLSRRTPSWLEFQPRLGFAFDPTSSGRAVVRGGYGIFYDQIFQNLTLFSLQQTRAPILQTLLLLTNTDVGVGDPFLRSFRYGVDPLPQPAATNLKTDLAHGAFGRINDPDITDPYVHKWSLGFQALIKRTMSLSSDYVHTVGVNEPRILVINPQIQSVCNPSFPTASPHSGLCVRESAGGVSRLFDRAFVDAGMGANRLAQINMTSTTNRSRYDSWATKFKFEKGSQLLSVAYILASSRSWGGQPTASYNGNSIAITAAQQFKSEEFGPTRFDERHRIVASGIIGLPAKFQIAHIFQLASARPYSPTTGLDIDGDGLAVNDRLCAEVDPLEVFRVRGNSAAVLGLNPKGCVQASVNSIRHGYLVDRAGNLLKYSARYLNFDLRLSKVFTITDSLKLSSFADVYNVFNSVNLSFAERRAVSPATSAEFFLQPFALYGSGFGQPIGRPRTFQFGLRLAF
jgi:hypothetical protein